MEQVSVEVPLARLEEDLYDPSSFGEDSRYLPDSLYIFKREDLADAPLDKQRTFYLTDDKFNEVKRAYLDKDEHIASSLEVAVVDAETGNVDYQLERKLSCLWCCLPFRKASLVIKSINGIDLFSVKEVRRRDLFKFSPINGKVFTLQRSAVSEWAFDIKEEGVTRLGTISKRYTPINRRIRTRDGHYHIKFNENAADLEDEIKYVIVMGCFLLVSEDGILEMLC